MPNPAACLYTRKKRLTFVPMPNFVLKQQFGSTSIVPQCPTPSEITLTLISPLLLLVPRAARLLPGLAILTAEEPSWF